MDDPKGLVEPDINAVPANKGPDMWSIFERAFDENRFFIDGQWIMTVY